MSESDWWHRPLAAEPGTWQLLLTSGRTTTVTASAFSREGDSISFVVLVEGAPPEEVEILRIPAADVQEIGGG